MQSMPHASSTVYPGRRAAMPSTSRSTSPSNCDTGEYASSSIARLRSTAVHRRIRREQMPHYNEACMALPFPAPSIPIHGSREVSRTGMPATRRRSTGIVRSSLNLPPPSGSASNPYRWIIRSACRSPRLACPAASVAAGCRRLQASAAPISALPMPPPRCGGSGSCAGGCARRSASRTPCPADARREMRPTRARLPAHSTQHIAAEAPNERKLASHFLAGWLQLHPVTPIKKNSDSRRTLGKG